MSKFEVAMVTLLLGYFLGQATDWMKHFFSVNRKKSAIRGEIKDLLEEFEYKLERIEEAARLVSDKSLIGVPIPTQVKSILYEKHFADIAPFYGKIKRKSILEFYNTLDVYNDGVNELSSSGGDDFQKKLVSLYYYAKLSEESARLFLDSNGKNDLKSDQSKLSKINGAVEAFASKYDLLNSN